MIDERKAVVRKQVVDILRKGNEYWRIADDLLAALDYFALVDVAGATNLLLLANDNVLWAARYDALRAALAKVQP